MARAPHLSWEEDRKFVLRGWSLVFSVLGTLLMCSMEDGRIAYLSGSYTGYVGFWTNCRRHKCANVGQVTVLIHMSEGFMMLALALCLILPAAMVLSFRPGLRRLNKIDFVFSFLGIGTGLLIFFSLMLFVVFCQTLRPKPEVYYLVAYYLCLCASFLMLWAGALSYLNQVDLWSKGRTPAMERRMSCRRWTLQRGDPESPPGRRFSGAPSLQSWGLPASGTNEGDPQAPPNTQASQDTDW